MASGGETWNACLEYVIAILKRLREKIVLIQFIKDSFDQNIPELIRKILAQKTDYITSMNIDTLLEKLINGSNS